MDKNRNKTTTKHYYYSGGFFLFPLSCCFRIKSVCVRASTSLICLKLEEPRLLKFVFEPKNICLGYFVRKVRMSGKSVKGAGLRCTSEQRQGVRRCLLRSQNFSIMERVFAIGSHFSLSFPFFLFYCNFPILWCNVLPKICD